MITKPDNVNLGKFGFPNYEVSCTGHIYNCRTQNEMAIGISRCGYPYVQLYHQNGNQYLRYVHRLVALAFIPTISETLQVNHIDGNKLNSHYLNLEWVTNRQNAHHALTNGLMPHAKITEELCRKICEKLQAGWGIKRISDELVVPYHTISAIKLGRNWTHISKEYVFPATQGRNDPMTNEEKQRILNRIAHGSTLKELVEDTRFSYDVLRKMLLRLK